jgi:hypothetical protein
MKKIIFIFFCLFLSGIIVTGCVKQSDCNCALTGKFVFLKDPYISDSSFYIEDEEIKAHFISDFNQIYYIYGTIPKKFQGTDTSLVNICVKTPYSGRTLDLRKDIYSITCIEMKN